jgi:hypothetical protein
VGTHFRLGSRNALAVVTAVAAIALIASTAWAVIPDASGTIHACYAPDGALRVIDTDAGQSCKKNERPLEWATAPTARLPDTFVVLRRSGSAVPATGTFTEITNLDLQPGRYQVTAKTVVGSQGTALDNPVRVFCSLVPSNIDGTPGTPGASESDSATLHLAPVSHPGEEAVIALFVSQELSQPGSVVLGCSASGNEMGADVRDTSVRAIEVGSITTDPGPPPLPN